MRLPLGLCLHVLLPACIAANLASCTRPAAPIEATGTKTAQAEAISAATAETPEQAANRLYSASRGADFGARLDGLAPDLRAVVERDNACVRQNDACEITSDPWLAGGGQEGGIAGSPRFNRLDTAPLQARVRMDYTYAWSDAQTQPQATCVLLSRESADAPWRLADLLADCDDTQSLLGTLRQAYPGDGKP